MDKNWEEIKQLAGEYASANLGQGMNCAESVLEALIRSGALDVPPETVALASGFGGGVGCSGFTCGALASAALANNIVHGRRNIAEIPVETRRADLRDRVYRRFNHLSADFVKIAGSGLCREIIGQYDGYFDPQARANCNRICGEAARLAVDYLQKGEDEVKTLAFDLSVIGIKGWKEV